MKLLQISLRIIVFIVAFSSPQNAVSQYLISGYLKTNKPDKTIYLAVLRFDEQNLQSESQIITSVKTDSTGYFRITGSLLSEQEKLYRIYANISDSSLDFIRQNNRRNYLNFIFSNKDTIFFPKNNSEVWFENSINTSIADKEWRKVIVFENDLKKELKEIQNPEALKQIRRSFLRKYKTYCNDSIVSPLVKLLVYSNLRDEFGELDNDYQEDPGFYGRILSQLKKKYGNSSYYSQFREELAKLTHTHINEKYIFHKYVNYILAIVIIALTLLLIKVLKSRNDILRNQLEEVTLNLSKQEQKIAHLIAKGKSNKEISSELFISISTVKTHITSIYSKLNATSRQEIIEKIKKHTRY